MKKVMISLAGLSVMNCVYAEGYATLVRDSEVFDSPNTKGYVTKNFDGDDVKLSVGMIVPVQESKNAWSLVEFSPGLRGYIMDSVIAKEARRSAPKAGSYNVTNNSKVIVNISNADGSWTLGYNGKNYSGKAVDGGVIFLNADKQIAYSLSVVDGKAYVYDYSNTVTHFF